MNMFKKFMKDDAGATAIEYGLIAAATGLVLVAVGPQLATQLRSVFGDINTALAQAANGGAAPQ